MTQPSPQASTASGTAQRLARSSYTIPVAPPFRLDLTVSALRRLPTNTIDVLTADGRYVHAFAGSPHPAIVHVRQTTSATLTVEIDADALREEDRERTVALVGRTLGVDRELADFYRAASALPWLNALAMGLRGLKPPRYRSLWEALVNAVVYQQVSLPAASAVVQRIIEAFGTLLESQGSRVHLFPSTERVLAATDQTLRGLGLSSGKLATLRRAADAIRSGTLDADTLEELPSVEAAARLRSIKGIGPWTASVVLLRGFGRLDVFPMNDSGVARSLALTADASPDVSTVLDTLGEQRGMLYYHLLLARLEARGDAGRASVPPR